jgi:hypothetical protein
MGAGGSEALVALADDVPEGVAAGLVEVDVAGAAGLDAGDVVGVMLGFWPFGAGANNSRIKASLG